MTRGKGSNTSPKTKVRDHWIPPQGPRLEVTGLRARRLEVTGPALSVMNHARLEVTGSRRWMVVSA